MNGLRNGSGPRRLNRRAFLYGLGGIGIGLPFLEGAPDRSAWAQDENPVFALFMGTGNGIVVENFWPAELGALTNLGTELGATGLLGDFADRLLLLRGLQYPMRNTAETHGQSGPQMLTGAPYATPVKTPLANSTAASIDVILAPLLNPAGTEPLTLYSGVKAGYINESLSWTAEGNPRPAEGSPFAVYAALVGGVGADSTGTLASAVLVRRQSAIDLARDELLSFQGRANISQRDSQRLEQHLTALRNIEQTLAESAVSTCSLDLVDVDGIATTQDTYKRDGMVEVVSKLHLELAALAFACNLNHVATLQSGDGLDQTHYDVPSNARGWSFHHISHEIQNDASVGDDPLAVQAHVEIDRLRMETFAHGLRQFDAHGLLDKTVVLWTNQFSEGKIGSFSDLPYILAGNPYGRLRSGQYIQCNNNYNGELLTTVANVLGVDRLIGTATRGLDELLA